VIRGYCRVSTVEQASQEKTSLADQERIVRAVAMMRNEDLVMYSDAGVSGSVPLDQRDAGSRMLSELKSGDVVVASKLDRIFRSTVDALTTVEKLKSSGVKIVLADISSEPVSDNGVGKLFFSMLAAFADFERERIADRAAAGRAGKKARGGHIGGDAPYGFIKEGTGAQAILKPNPYERKIIERMEFLYHMKASYRQVVKHLNAEGLYGREGPWTGPQQIIRILGRG
jgi:DNA invertase Pin-like site-specific DNA recombinase